MISDQWGEPQGPPLFVVPRGFFLQPNEPFEPPEALIEREVKTWM